MKNQFKLSVNSPCGEKFENFTSTARGGFCSSCSKEVVDFTSMTDQEIVDFFDSNNDTSCGRFYKSQLKSYELNDLNKTRNYTAIGVIGLSLASLLAGSPANAQEKKPPVIEVWKPVQKDSVKPLDISKTSRTLLEGIVSDAHGSLPGVSVLLKGTAIGTETDFDGKFKFPRPLKSEDVLIFSYLGYETVEIKIGFWTKTPMTVVMKEGGMILGALVITGEVQVEKLFKSRKAFFKKKKKE